MTDVRDPRNERFSPQLLEDPRPEPNRDVLAVNRRWLKANRGAKSKREVSMPHEQEALDNLARANYRYTKNPPVLNDNLGYGEQIRETFWMCKGDRELVELPRISQRTRTGRQALDLQHQVTTSDPPPDIDGKG